MYLRPTLTTLQQQAINDITSANLPGVTSVLRRSVLRVLSYVISALSYGNYGYIDWVSKQAIPYTSSGEYLEAWAAFKGILRRPASLSAGTVLATGATGAVIPSGSTLVRADGVLYATTVDAQLTVNPSNPSAGGTATVHVQSVTPGASGNTSSNTLLTFLSPLTGVNSIAFSQDAAIGGSDMETDDSLRARMLLEFANPPQGGSLTDYVEWCLQIPGVTRAWALGGGSGAGSVTVYVMYDQARSNFGGFPQGKDGAATLERRAAQTAGTDANGNHDQLDVANYLYPLRPATALVYVASPKAFSIDISIVDLVPDTPDIQNAIKLALTDMFTRVADPRYSVLFPSDINAAIDSVPGINHYTLSNPTDHTLLPTGTIPVLGNLQFTAGTVPIF